MKPEFFATPADFRKWLERNHAIENELLVGFYRVGSGRKSITWSEAVDQALCFGWIDGVRRSIDDLSYQIRFTPRKPGSNWSAINIEKVAELTKQGLMRKEGLAAFEKRKEHNSRIYSYENELKKLTPDFEKAFKADRKAWKYFQSLAPSYRKTSVNWVMSAKQEATRVRRLKALIADSNAGTNQWKDNKYGGKRGE
jgi:uncharacterized protein YdeI (YjbR/CyaY-like superfamily)